MLATLSQLIAFGTWANSRILASLRSTARHHKKPLHLLAHLLVSERIWLLRLRGEDTSTINKSPELSNAECEDLANRNQLEYSAFLASLGEADLNSPITYRNFKGTKFNTPIKEILMHVILHGTYHRGQIALAMRDDGDVPVDTDFITFVREREVSKCYEGTKQDGID